MNPKKCILLYSKYSRQSKLLIDTVHGASVDLYRLLNLSMLCIDSETVRSRILKSNDISITVVPCILVLYNDGGVEKYDGTTAQQWINDILSKYTPNPQESLLNQEYSSEEEEERPKKKKKKKKKKMTRISDIDSDEDDQWDDEAPSRPPVGIRSGAGDYDISGDFGEIQPVNRNVRQGIKDTGNTGGKPDLLTAAMEMQKMRENDDSKIKPVGMPIGGR
jgi:hypothetical protein